MEEGGGPCQQAMGLLPRRHGAACFFPLFWAASPALALSVGSWLNEAAAVVERGGVYVKPSFLSADEVRRLRSDAHALLAAGRFRSSGLTKTSQVSERSGSHFSARAGDRSLCSLNYDDGFVSGLNPVVEDLGGDIVARKALAARVEEVRLGLAEACLSTRPSLGSDGLGHEAAYSIYGPGAFLERHLDEVSLDKVVREGSERGNKGKTMRVFARPDSPLLSTTS